MAIIHSQSSSRTFLQEVGMARLSSSTQDILEVHHVRACLCTTTDQRSITSPCKHPVCAAHAARSHRKSLCFIKRSIHRLAHTDLIRTVREDRDTQQQRGRIIRSLTLGNVRRRRKIN